MDYYGVDDVSEIGTDFIIALGVAIISLLVVLVFIFLIKWGVTR